MNVDGGIDAVALESGAVQWTAPPTRKPLAITGHSLLVQVAPACPGVLALEVLDESDGTERRRIDVALPESVLAAVGGSDFQLDSHELPSGAVLEWRYLRRTPHGSENVPAEPAGAAPELRGAVHVDPESGDVRPATGEELAMSEPPAPPEISFDVTGYTIRYASADRRNLLASRRSPPPNEGYDWVIFSLATGDRVAQLHMNVPAAWFFVAGNLLVHEVRPRAPLVGTAREPQPGKIRAVDLHTGTERWAHPVRDTADRGSLPPDTPSPGDASAPPETQHQLR